MPVPLSKVCLDDVSDRAMFGTAARLLSCLVTESLVPAVYKPNKYAGKAAGFAILLNGDVALDQPFKGTIAEVLAVIPLHHPPVLRDPQTLPGVLQIGLLDPLDMIPIIFEARNDTVVATSTLGEENLKLVRAANTSLSDLGYNFEDQWLRKSDNVRLLWDKFAASIKLDESISVDIAGEFSSAIKWQRYWFENAPEPPQFSSPSIDWEQSIVSGHPTHPMHKTRYFLPPLPDYTPGSCDLLNPRLRFVSLPRSELNIIGDFEDFTVPLLFEAYARIGEGASVQDAHAVVPVHALQITHIRDKFPSAYIYPENIWLPLLAQQSLRSVILLGQLRNFHLKLAIGVKLTSAVRTISPESAFFGPHFSAKVVPVLTFDRNILTVARELASAVHNGKDGSISKHCAAIVRECWENTSEDRNERLIVCTSLVESGHRGTDGTTSSIVRVFDLDTEQKRLEWLRKFVSVFLKAFLPPMIENGVAFECHPQNCLARFDLQTKELKGFIVRDFGGLKVHPPTLKRTTGVDLDYVEGHSVVSETLEDVYTRMYHTIIHNHFQQLIRILDQHYSGKGWEIVRQELRSNIPEGHSLYKLWLSQDSKTFPGKCFMRMRMVGAYRFHLHAPFQNLIHYKGVEVDESVL